MFHTVQWINSNILYCDSSWFQDHHVPILIRGSVNGEDDDFFKDSEDEDSSSDETAERKIASASGTAASVTTASDATASRTTAEASDVTASRTTASGTAASENRTPYTRPNGSENKHLLVRSQSQVSDSFFKHDRDKWDLTTQQIIPHINGKRKKNQILIFSKWMEPHLKIRILKLIKRHTYLLHVKKSCRQIFGVY